MSAAHTRILRLALVLASVLLASCAFASAAIAAKAPKPSTTTTTAKAKAKAKAKPTPVRTTTRFDAAKFSRKCWNDLIRDWYDGRIDRTYPVHCYRDALKHLPTDVRTYSDAYDVISRALADVTRGKKRVDPDAPVPPPGGGSSGGGGGGGTGNSNGGGGGVGPTVTGDGGGGGPIAGGLNTGDRGANGVPLPLIILGALAVLLVAAGAAGLIARRIQARRGLP